MVRRIHFFFLFFAAFALLACGCSKGSKNAPAAEAEAYTPKPAASSPYKVRVAKVYNDTHAVHDVDVIGRLWNGIEESLKAKGMLWDEKSQGADPYVMECHVVLFKEADVPVCAFPVVGNTVLEVRCELSRGGAHLATIESKRSSSYSWAQIRRKAWKKQFEIVSEDVVNQAVKKF